MNRSFYGLIAAALATFANTTAQEKPVVAPVLPPPATGSTETRRSENLNSDQREKLRSASTELREKQGPLYEKLRAARKELEQVVQADELNEKLIREKAAALGAIEGELALLRAKHFQSVKGMLPKLSEAGAQPGTPSPGAKAGPKNQVRPLPPGNLGNVPAQAVPPAPPNP